MWRIRPILMSALAVLGLSGCGGGCGVPGTAFDACFYYYTDDMTPVSVLFFRYKNTKQYNPATATIPRAYIHFAAPGYDQTKQPVLPTRIEVEEVMLGMAYPSGQPIKIARSALTKEGRFPRDVDIVRLMNTAKNFDFLNVPEKYGNQSKNSFYAGQLGPFRRYVDYAAADVYYKIGAREIRRITCMTAPDQAIAVQKCSYSVVLNEAVWAEMSFPDFRVNGGLSFAEDRVRAITETLCKFVKCD